MDKNINNNIYLGRSTIKQKTHEDVIILVHIMLNLRLNCFRLCFKEQSKNTLEMFNSENVNS